MYISKVYNRVEPKVSGPWPRNSVNEASMSLPKDSLPNSFIKAMFSLKNIQNVSDQ